MLGIKLEGHDYKYEVAELFKLFTTQFRFIKDNEEFEKTIVNETNIDNVVKKSTTKYYENNE